MIKNKQVFKSRGVLVIIICLFSTYFYAQSSTENYVKTTTYKVETTTQINSPSASQASIEVTYFDGLGRTKQKVAHRQAGTGNDLVTHIAYDGFGRMPKSYLPFERATSLNFDPNALANTEAFYNTPEFDNTLNPFTEKEIEHSALERVLRQASPGNDWAMDDDHEIRMEYMTNSTNEVYNFTEEILSGTAPNNILKYPIGQLYKTVIKDENWEVSYGNKGKVIEFKDKMGRLILKRMYDLLPGQNKSSSTNYLTLDTYYVYDNYGNLSYVLPPKLSHQIRSGNSLASNYQHLLDELGYQYKFDFRNRLIEKKVPGKHWEFMVYDPLDRIIATGPSLSPFGDQAEGWLHTKYDIHNRVVYTAWKQGTISKSTRATMTNNLSAPYSEERSSSTNTINGVDISYSNVAYPTSGYEVLTINYYDDYSYNAAPSVPATVGEGDINVYYKNTAIKKPKGLVTGSWVRVLESASQQKGVESHTFYDKKARPVRVQSSNIDNGYNQIDTKYNYIGNPEYTITKHKKDGAASTIDIKEDFFYNNRELITKHNHKIENETTQVIARNSYDKLNRVFVKQVGGLDGLLALPLQKIDYNYNVRGWLKSINHILNLDESGQPTDLFAFSINYNNVTQDVNNTVLKMYNGNIAETMWRTASDNIRRQYSYSYDHQNRLLDANYVVPATSIPLTESYSTQYDYDRNGNLTSLLRNGDDDDANNVIAIDDLIYEYDDGNKLINVKDDEAHSSGYDDLNTNLILDDFEYDSYGNLTKNRDKSIEQITYNHLNLPVEIDFGAQGIITYLYDAVGIKLKKTVDDDGTIAITNYKDGFQYLEGDLDFFPHPEGYVKILEDDNGNDTYNYVYHHKDHLGNIRVSYAKDPDTGETAILKENHYYPYGLQHNGYNGNHITFGKGSGNNITLTPVDPFLGDSYKYGFGGKEFEDSFDLNTYDFGARNYDPALGRWMNIDPASNIPQSISLSPYNYAKNNPIIFIDPDGMKWKNPVKAEKLKSDIKKVQKGIKKNIARIQKKIDNKNLSNKAIERKENRIANKNTRVDRLDGAIKDIDALGADTKNTFNLVSGGELNYVEKGKDGVINIQGPNNALHIHEIKHVALSLKADKGLQYSQQGRLMPTTSNGMADEIAAYGVQWAYKPTSIPGSVSAGGNVDWTTLAYLKDADGNLVYPALMTRLQNDKKQKKAVKKFNKKNK